MLNIIWICRLFVVIDQNVDIRMFTRLVSAMQVYWWGWGLLSDISDLVTSLPPFLPPHHTHSDQWRLFNMFSGSGRTQWCSPESWPLPLPLILSPVTVSPLFPFPVCDWISQITNIPSLRHHHFHVPSEYFVLTTQTSLETGGETRDNFNQLRKFSRHLV